MLELRAMSVSYGAARAVADLDLAVGSGEVVALLGPNGAGKTSTLRAISGLVRHTGEIRFDGDDLRGLTTSEIARRGLIHVPEGRHVIPTLTVLENLQLGRVAAAGRRGDFGIDEVFDLMPPLAELRRRLGFALSGGEQQMVAVGRALVAAPTMLLLDEPSLGLAPVVVQSIYKALAKVAASIPVLLVEQNTADALKLAARAYVVVAGVLRLEGTSRDFADRGELLRSFLGQRGTGSERRA